MRKRILHIITGLEVGGAETNLSRILPFLEGRFENRICCLKNKGPMSEKFEKNNIPIYYLNINGVMDFLNPSVILRFRTIIKNFDPETIETYLIHSDLFGRIWGKIFGVGKIVCNHRGSLLQWQWLRFFDKITSFLVDKYVFQTPSSQAEISQKLGISTQKTAVIPNAIDIDEYRFVLENGEKIKSLGIEEGKVNIASVSNLRIGKGQKYLIEAFEKVYLEGYRDINLLIVGDGEQRPALENQAKNCQSRENIHFLGKRSDVLEILRICSIFVLPTFYEGMSNAIMEAMASKNAIITTDIDVNKDLIRDGHSGILVPVKNSEKIAKSIIDLIKNPRKRELLGNNAFEEIRNRYSIEAVSGKISTLLESI